MNRQRALFLLAASSLFQTALAQPAVISIPRAQASPGASLLIPVTFATRLPSVGGLQFDLQYDSSVLTLTATVGDAARNSFKTLSSADLAPNQRRFLFRGLNQNPIVDGNLVNLFVSVSLTAPPAAYILQFSDVVGTDPAGQPATVEAANGIVTVAGAIDPASRLQSSGVLNAAGLFPGPVSPGEMLTFLGAGIGPDSPQQPIGSPTGTVLGGTGVAFDGIPAPLLYAASNQVNAIAPYGIFGSPSTRTVLTQGGQGVPGLLLPVADAAPGIFTQDGSGVGQGAILNQDQSLNSPSNPTLQGSIVTLFATGAGQTDPPGVDGLVAAGTLPKPLLPISVQIGGVDAKVLYAGAAPTEVAGLLQVDCVVPQAAPTGLAVPVVLFVGETGSQAGVTLAIGSPLSSSAAPGQAATACDLSPDGVVDALDVHLADNMALGLAPCTAGVAGPGVCNIVAVQRVVNAALGGPCVTGTPHSVALTWSASASLQVIGYNVYRGTISNGPYTKVNSLLIADTVFTDNAVQSGQTLYYVVTAVDNFGNESVYSNQAQAVIPSP